MPTPIDQLQAEHRVIEKGLRALNGLSQRLEHGVAVDPAAFEKMFDFLEAFAEAYHHRKEENCLFPALGLHGVPRDRGPIGVMLQEHCTGRALIAHMKRAASGYANGDEHAARLFARSARDYVRLLTDHMHKEDQVVFRLAESLLDSPAMQALQDEFDAAERDAARVRAKYEKEAEDLERAWAG